MSNTKKEIEIKGSIIPKIEDLKIGDIVTFDSMLYIVTCFRHTEDSYNVVCLTTGSRYFTKERTIKGLAYELNSRGAELVKNIEFTIYK